MVRSARRRKKRDHLTVPESARSFQKSPPISQPLRTKKKIDPELSDPRERQRPRMAHRAQHGHVPQHHHGHRGGADDIEVKITLRFQSKAKVLQL